MLAITRNRKTRCLWSHLNDKIKRLALIKFVYVRF